MKDMYIGEKKKKPFVAPLVLGVVLAIGLWVGNKYHTEKLTEAHTKGFVEGCANILAYSIQANTGYPLHPQQGQMLMMECLRFKKMIENPQPPQFEPRERNYGKEKTI